MRRALISVSDKTGLVLFAHGLRRRGFDIVSTGGTARALDAAGIPVRPVSDLTGFPEMLDGRIKTLHPGVHGGILARRDHAEDLKALAEHGIGLIDLVAVNLYPFAKAAARADTSFDDLVEQIDIGGPTLVRAAAKNFRHVLVIVDPDDYPRVLEELDRADGPTLASRLALAQTAFRHTAEYDATIHTTLGEFMVAGDRPRRHGEDGAERRLPAALRMQVKKLRDLRYGENPHQPAALYEGYEHGFKPWDVLQGKELSYTNLLDLDAAARLASEFEEPAAVVVKHTNPCGAAAGATAVDAYVRAREGDAGAAFGGIVAVNRAIDEALARSIVSTFIEAVIAPAVDDAARPILATKGNMRVVTARFERFWQDRALGHGGDELRTILGGVLVQARDHVTEARTPWPLADGTPKVATRRAPTAEEWRALRFAWRVCAHVKSNAVIFTGPDRTLAIGAGQMSRVDAVNVAVMKGTTSLTGSVAASDGFFPFRDGLDAVAAAGATAVVQPGGSVRDAEVIAAADEHGLAMVFTGGRHFRH